MRPSAQNRILPASRSYNREMNRVLSALILAGLASTMALAQEVYDLSMKPKAGLKIAYSIKIASPETQTPAGNFSLNVNLKTKTTFLEVTDKEIISEDEVTDFEVLLNGNPMDMVADQVKGVKTKITRSHDWKVIKTEGGENPMSASPRYEAMMAFATPMGKVKIGDEIVREMPGSKEKGIVPARGKMTVKEAKMVEGVKYLVLEVAYSELEGEKPMGMVGTVLVEAATGMLHSIKATMNDVTMNPMMPPMNLTMNMVRIPVE